MNSFSLFFCLYFFGLLLTGVNCTNIILDLIKNNVAGDPILYKHISWPIYPDEGIRRRKDYEAVNGRYGYKHVERLGLGEDNRAEERRLQQKIRDEMGALSYIPPA